MEVIVYTIGFTMLVMVTLNLTLRFLAAFLWVQELVSLACTIGWLRITGVVSKNWKIEGTEKAQ
ncbi:MAG: hypothetical protein KGJ23_08295 [Euryarchaeota archaeon]|nr:hypothetical protein [Euryarchaeota archaeon]MDE1836602.1 hypothetical protein [Euryarchaeota archaeon]MDE2044572.1 hypothetical protein [Thermoplasmata archaeon]